MKHLISVNILIVGLFVSEARADVECVFVSRSTPQGLEGLDSHSYRVVNVSGEFELEIQTADGNWLTWVQMERADLPNYLVFQHYPNDLDGNPYTLTIHKSGRATLLQYVDPYTPWLNYGECTQN